MNPYFKKKLRAIMNAIMAQSSRMKHTFSGIPPFTMPKVKDTAEIDDFEIEGNTIQDEEIPVGYARLEYIYITDGKYINTQYVPKGTEIIDLEFEITNFGSSSGWHDLFGCIGESNATSSKQNYWCAVNNSGQLYFRFGTVNISEDFPIIELNTKYKLQINLVNKKIILNDTEYSIAGTNIGNITRSIFLGQVNPTTALANTDGTTRFYNFKITNNNTIIKNYIPCSFSTSSHGFYDIINKKYSSCYTTNTGYGPVILSPDNSMEIKNTGEKTVNLYDYSLVQSTTTLSTNYAGIDLDPSKSYTLGIKPRNGATIPAASIGIGYRTTEGGGIQAQWVYASGNANVSVMRKGMYYTTLAAGKFDTAFCIYPANLASAVNEAFDILLIEGTYLTARSMIPYEPYNKYKIPITVKNINLFDLTEIPKASGNTCVQDYEKVSVINYYAGSLPLLPEAFLEMTEMKEKDYFRCTRTGTVIKGASTQAGGQIRFNNIPGNSSPTLILPNNIQRQIPEGFNQTNYQKNIYFYGCNQKDSNNESEYQYSNIMLVKGQFDAEDMPDYEDNKTQLFDKNNYTSESFYLNNSVTGTVGNYIIGTPSIITTIPIKVKKNTDYMITKTAGKMFMVCGSIDRPANNIPATCLMRANTAASIKINSRYFNWLSIAVWRSSDTITVDEMLNSVKVYEIKHRVTNIITDKPLYGIGEYKDKIIIQDGQVKRIDRIDKVNIQTIGGIYKKMTNTVRFSIGTIAALSPNILTGIDKTTCSICDQLPCIPNAWTLDAETFMWHTNGTTYPRSFYPSFSKTRLNILDDDTDAAMISKARAYLAENPLTVYYPTVEVETDITDLNPDLPGLFEGTTILEVNTTTPPSNVTLNYYED